MVKVSLVNIESYDPDKVYLAVKESIKKINYSIPKNKTVLIKPNILSQNKPSQHSITHYTIIDALCRILKDNSCKIKIGESMSFYQKGLTRKAFKTSRIEEVAEKYGAELVAFDEEPLVEIKNGLLGFEKLYLPKILLKVDAIIDACKLKSHSGLRLSGAVKNMFGSIPGGYKQKAHIWKDNDYDLSDVFIDICSVLKPSLAIMDAIYGLDGGPTAIGKPVKVGRIIASVSPYHLDIVASKIIGYEPENIATLVRAKERGIIKNYNEVEIIGEMPSVKFKSLIKGPIKEHNKVDMFVTDTFVNPFIKKSKCTKCLDCIKFCPVFAIKESVDYPSIDYSKCINCYYCLKACPDNAIGVKSSWKNKFINLMRLVLGI